MTLKIGFVFQKDSHFKAVYYTALRMQDNKSDFQFFSIDSQYMPKDACYPINNIASDNFGVLVDYDYVICCLGGYLLNIVVGMLRDTDTKVISLFPGIVSHYQLDAFLSRLSADEVWLNSKADFELYDKICKILGVRNNGRLHGMPWLKKEHYDDIGKNNIIFFEQTQILGTDIKKSLFIERIHKFISFHNDKKIFYKIRDNATDAFFLEFRMLIAKYDNVCVIDSIDCINADTYVSLSSSALINAIVNDKKAYLLDKNLLDMDSVEFYEHSGLFLDDNLKLDKLINRQWLTDRVCYPLDIVITNIRKNQYWKPSIAKYTIYWLVLRLCLIDLKYRKLLNKKRLKAIKKSFEYIKYIFKLI
ncbi:DUF6716 putative glycosyltransferase [Moraxella bovis]|uniref:DUF6716 putative glycosyltransferase n=1 Tax=Moraxella bovis TaxID=476 RepID=UPI000DC7A41C|nr:DUF6716 putative glycosyltransferase [Moraxella bovis]AWY19184.1 hypothetical protein DQF64_00695 [Moraxella bovis]